MFQNYFKTGIRNLLRYKTFSILNILGLGLGIGCALLIFVLFNYHSTFDNFHKNADRVYRAASVLHFDGIINTPGVPSPFGPAIRADFPEIKFVSNTKSYEKGAITIEENGEKRAFESEERAFMVDPTYFELFDAEFITGSPTVLEAPYKAILTEKSAKNFFGENNPLGRSFRFNDEFDVIVEGVIKDIPANTDFMGGIYISYATFLKEVKPEDLEMWNSVSSSNQVFMLLPENSTAEGINTQLKALSKKYLKPEEAEKYEFIVQPLKSLHFNTDFGGEVPYEIVFALGLVGLFLLLTACINFINLATAQALNRSKEVGVRKVLGGSRGQLFAQFMSETFIIVFLSLLFGIAFALLCLPKFNALTEAKMTMNFLDNPILLWILAGILVIVTLLAGSYPAFVLAGFEPSKAIKGSIRSGSVSKFNLRRSLVIAQFMICQILIVGLIVISSQMEFVKNRDLGFKTEGIVSIPLPDNKKEKMESFGQQLRNIKGVNQLSFNHDEPASHSQNTTNHGLDGGEDENWQVQTKIGDENYLKTFGLTLVAGKDFMPTDTVNQFIINEETARRYGFANPADIVGKQLKIWGTKAPIVGVVKDFHARALSDKVGPMAIIPEPNAFHNISMVIDLNQTESVLLEIEKTYHKAFPGIYYAHEFLDESIARFYTLENILLQLVRFFCGIAIFIACLGLYGLVSFMSLHKKKEIGVRKVLGASMASILGIFGKEFLVLLLIGFVFAAPLAYFAMNAWLSDYAYRIELGPWIFLVTLFFTLLLTLITVGWQSYKAAVRPPSESLRSE